MGHITSVISNVSKAEDDGALVGCKVIGVINEVALIASNLWYVMLAVDLIKAIRNPFRYIDVCTFSASCHINIWGV